jgi:hypothetical protein
MTTETVHPMVMKAARAMSVREAKIFCMSADAEWEVFSTEHIEAAQAALTECGALDMDFAIEMVVKYADSEPDGGDTVEIHRANIERARTARAKARDLSSAGLVYGSAPE